MGQQPGLQVLTAAGLHIEHPAGTQHGDEDLHRPDLAGRRLHDGHPVAGKVHEHALSGRVLHAQHHVLLAQPALALGAEPAVAPALGLSGSPLQPEQAEREVAVALEFAVHLSPLRQRPAGRQLGRRRREQHCLQARLVELRRQRPAQPGRLRPGQVLVDGGLAGARAAGDLPVVHTCGLEPQHLANLAHGQSPYGHADPPDEALVKPR